MREIKNKDRLTKRAVDAAAPAAERYTLWDRELKGFGVRVEPSGVKTFIVRYRAGGGRRGTLRQFKIGRYGKLTPEQARSEAEKLLALAELGQDPQLARLRERAEMTVAELCDIYIADGVAAKKESTLKLDRIRIERHIKPLLGKLRLSEVSFAQVDKFMRDVASGKVRDEARPHTRGGKGAASRSVGLLSGIFGFAIKRGFLTSNPTKGVQRYPDQRRERFLSGSELGRLGDAFAAALDAGVNPQHVAILQLLLFTGARKNEIARLTWDEVDLVNGRLNLADAKSGKRAVVVPALGLGILNAQPRTESAYVFPDPRDPAQPVRGLDWAWVNIRAKADSETCVSMTSDIPSHRSALRQVVIST